MNAPDYFALAKAELEVIEPIGGDSICFESSAKAVIC